MEMEALIIFLCACAVCAQVSVNKDRVFCRHQQRKSKNTNERYEHQTSCSPALPPR